MPADLFGAPPAIPRRPGGVLVKFFHVLVEARERVMQHPVAQAPHLSAGYNHVGVYFAILITSEVAAEKTQAGVVLPAAVADAPAQKMIEPPDAVAVHDPGFLP